MVKKYQVDLTVIELNPTGLFAAVGFSDQLRLVQIFMQDLRVGFRAIFVSSISNGIAFDLDHENLQFSTLQRCEILELGTFDGGRL